MLLAWRLILNDGSEKVDENQEQGDQQGHSSWHNSGRDEEACPRRYREDQNWHVVIQEVRGIVPLQLDPEANHGIVNSVKLLVIRAYFAQVEFVVQISGSDQVSQVTEFSQAESRALGRNSKTSHFKVTNLKD